MKNVELYGRVRYAVRLEGLSERAAARRATRTTLVRVFVSSTSLRHETERDNLVAETSAALRAKPQGPKLGPVQGMHAFDPAFSSVHVQATVPQVDLRPAKLAELGRAKAVSIR